MIDERNEELASLYALDLLEGDERLQFETALLRDPALRAFVHELRESSSSLTHMATVVEPPAELKQRILSSIADRQPAATPDNIIRPAVFGFRQFLPWAIAACFAVGAGWVGQLYLSSRSEADLLSSQQQFAEVALKQAQNQLEAERLLSSRQIVDLNQQISDSVRRLADLQRSADENDQRRIAVQNQEAEARRQLADAQTRLLAAEKLLADAHVQATELKAQGDVANLKIATLTSMLNNSPEALAVAVWNPGKQEGVFTVEKMPAPAVGRDLQLWVIEDKPSAQPVSAGLLIVGPDGTGRAQFKTESPVGSIAKFAISLEKKGGAPAHSGPQGDVIMISK